MHVDRSYFTDVLCLRLRPELLYHTQPISTSFQHPGIWRQQESAKIADASLPRPPMSRVQLQILFHNESRH